MNKTAPFSQKVGNTVSQYSLVIGDLGAAEMSSLPRLALLPEDWKILLLAPRALGNTDTRAQ